MIVVQHSAQPLAARGRPSAIDTRLFPYDQAIAQALVVSLVMVMRPQIPG